MRGISSILKVPMVDNFYLVDDEHAVEVINDVSVLLVRSVV